MHNNDMLEINPIPAFKDNYIWCLVDPDSKSVAVVDPGEASGVIKFLQQSELTLSAILITHYHWDHAGGIDDLINYQHVPVYASAIQPVSHLSNPVGNGSTIHLPEIGNLTLNVIEIPGHTLGHIAFYGNGMIFSGDTLFSAGCGRVFEGSYQQMYDSLLQLHSLGDDMQIYCGHEYTLSNLKFASQVEPGNPDIHARIKEVQQLREQNLPSLPSSMLIEKRVNPFLRCKEPDIVAAAEKHAGMSLSSPTDVFQVLREWKDTF